MQHNNSEFINYLRLARSKNVGANIFFRLLKNFDSATKSIQWLEEYSLDQEKGKKIEIASISSIEEELEKSEKIGAKILIHSDENYPNLLREISDAPPVLCFRGNISLAHQNCVAIVGPRNASMNAISFTKKVAQNLSENSAIITSGMARGVDSAAHQAAINYQTIAVIAGGIDHIYPQENSKLYHQICEHGLVISENPFNTRPKGFNFIQRNRIISGLCKATIVIEAGMRSGSLTTARFANEQNRDVFASPGSPIDERCRGTNRLIKQGAKMLESAEDFFDEYPQWKKPLADELHQERKELKISDDSQKIAAIILTKLDFLPIEIDQLSNDLQIPTKLLNAILMELELADKIEISLGKVSLKIHTKT